MGHLMSTMANLEAADQAAAAAEPMSGPAMAQAVADTLEPPMPTAEAEPGAPLPRVSTMLVFHPRSGEILRGRKEVAAMVVNQRPDQRLLDLIVFYDADDVRQIDRVPERTVEGERGWEMPRGPIVAEGGDFAGMDMRSTGHIVRPPADNYAAVLNTLELMRQEVTSVTSIVFGEFAAPEVSVLEMINTLNEQVDELEKKLDAALADNAKAATPRKARTVPAPRVEAAADETQVARTRGRFGGKR
jgi:hypothetical protein